MELLEVGIHEARKNRLVAVIRHFSDLADRRKSDSQVSSRPQSRSVFVLIKCKQRPFPSVPSISHIASSNESGKPDNQVASVA